MSRTIEPTEPDPVDRARRAGIVAAWTGDCSGAVQLARLAGPRHGQIGETDVPGWRPPGAPPWNLADGRVRAALYERILRRGTQFDFYRWINLPDLAAVWHRLHLPAGVHREWATVLQAAGLLPEA